MKGFSNDGNTCYFNTALQCLLHTPVLSNYYMRKPYEGECAFTQFYSNFVKDYWMNGQSQLCVKPLLSKFREKFPRFKTREQHDVQEAILCIIDILECSCPFIKPWFYGKKHQETIWPGGKSTSEEPFSVHLVTSNGKNLRDMLEKSMDWSVLENFEDTEGKIHNVATTRSRFSELPQILMISFDRKSHIKIIETIIIDSFEYNLVATALHEGDQNDGHYVSFVKCRNRWHFINDHDIKQCPLPEEAGYYFMVYNLKTRAS